MTNNPPIGDDDLHAYVDGRLLPARRAELEAWLADHPEDAMRAQFYARVNAELHRHFDPVLAEPVSDALAHPPKARRTPAWQRAAIAATWIAVGATGGWFAHGWYDEGTIARVAAAPPLPVQAAIAHAVYSVEKRHPVEVGIDEEAHL
ncbi:MAG TPA: anti-sigma factor, partial [Alphaproteobacteria bacterium]|nr:anti-sigma factor [Alphaproteobacteria bacterium]